MKTYKKLWNKLPVIVKAVLTGLTVLAAGNLPWSILLILNTGILAVIPWSSIIMVFYLWLLYKYLNGRWQPERTSVIRKEYLRAVPLEAKKLGWSLIAGFTGLLSLSFLFVLYAHAVDLNLQSPLPDLTKFNALFIAASILMISIVAGFVEEAAFRGYMQVPLERKYGPAVAIIVVGFIFGLTHFTHANMSLLMMPLYMASSVIFGLLAYFSKSIIPGVILHSFGDALELMLLWLTGGTLTSGVKNIYVILTLVIILSIVSIISFRKLKREMIVVFPEKSSQYVYLLV